MDKGEFELIAALRARGGAEREGVTGIGDDCAVLPQRAGFESLVTTDMLMEGVHFLRLDADPFDLGWKSAAVNLSDIAAMGGSPVGTFLSFALPEDLNSHWVDRFADGYMAVSGDCPLLGGDTTLSLDRICINVAVLGECPAGQSRKRSDARLGDGIYVTGPLGDSAGGLKVIMEDLSRGEDERTLVHRHYHPVPRVEMGLALSSIKGVHAMMDISDGVASDLRHILDASNVGAEVEVAKVPLSECLRRCASRYLWDALELALCGGEDYELLFTADPLSQLPKGCTRIGTIVSGADIKWLGSERDYSHGFVHF